MKKDYFAIFLYKLILIYIVFDGFRDNLIISTYISYFKEISTLFLFLYIILVRKIIIFDNILFYILLIFLLLLIIFFPYSFMSYDYSNRYLSSPVIMYYKLLQFFILVYNFSIYELITKDKYENLLKFFIRLLIIYVIFTPIIYFYKPFFMVHHFEQWGRINIGYPTMDAENLVLGILLMLFVFKERFIKALIVFMFLFLGILMQNTATGYITLIAILSFYIFSRTKFKVNKKVLFILFILLFIIVGYIIYRYADVLHNQLFLLERKINSIINPESSRSLSLRRQEFHSLIIYLQDWFTNLFGIGFKIYLENQYDWFRIGTGLIGYIIYIVFLSSLIIYGWFIRNKDRNILFLSSVVFALTSYSLITLYLFPTEASFAMMIGYSVHLQRRYKIAQVSN